MPIFFVSTQPGFEEELCQELQEFWPYLLNKEAKPHGIALPEVKVIEGGIELTVDEILGLQINFFSKLAGRVLLRLGTFRARDFAELEFQFRQMKGQLLRSESVRLEVTASQSRLNNEKRLAESFSNATKVKILDGDDVQRIYIRMFDDQCTVSLDTSGEHLHFRGYRLEQGEAPLRETIASFCLRKMLSSTGAAETQKISLLDPMMGSGTFLVEAADLYRPNLRRSYAFMGWKNCPALMKSPSLAANYPIFPRLFAKLVGRDQSEKMLEISRRNLQRAGLLGDLARPMVVDLAAADIFSEAASEFAADQDLRTWVLSNPPYGNRLPSDRGIIHYLQQIVRKFNPEKIGLLVDSQQMKDLVSQKKHLNGLTIISENKFRNGGLPVSLMILSAVDRT